jgi:ribosomal protein L29
MKLDELRNKTVEELTDLLKETRAKLTNARFKISVNQLKTVHEVKDHRKLVSRILTILKERELTNNDK